MPHVNLNFEERAQKVCRQADVDDYQLQGAVLLKGLLNAAEVSLLTEGIEKNLETLSPRAKIASRKDDPGLFVEDFCNWREIEEYERFICDSPLAAVAARLMQSRCARLYHDHLLVKESHTAQVTPWHQDQPYYNVDGKQNCSFWIPVDSVPRAHTLEFVGGSHLGPWLMPRSFCDNQAKWFPEGSLGELPDIENNRRSFSILGWAVEPGDVVAFHMLTLHASSGVQERRRVFSVRFLGDDMVHAPRPWVTSPHFAGLEQALPAGVAMEHELFPVLWPK